MARRTITQPTSDWALATLARVRTLIGQAIPGVVEERKWRKASNAMAGVPVWSVPGADGRSAPGGMICTGETYKDKVKLTFAKGALLPDPAGLFNAGLEGGTRRAIDLREGDRLNARAFKALVKAAAAGGAKATRPTRSKERAARSTTKPRLLSGGNPQIAKAVGEDGPAAVRAFIEAMSGGGPGWKRTIGERLDRLIERTVRETLPGACLRKAVKWNSPLYGVDRVGQQGDNGGPDGDAKRNRAEHGPRKASVRQEWFLGVHCFARYVKVAFFRGAMLQPMPPGESRQKHVRYLDIAERGWGDPMGFDEAQLAAWIRQAAMVPGEMI